MICLYIAFGGSAVMIHLVDAFGSLSAVKQLTATVFSFQTYLDSHLIIRCQRICYLSLITMFRDNTMTYPHNGVERSSLRVRNEHPDHPRKCELIESYSHNITLKCSLFLSFLFLSFDN